MTINVPGKLFLLYEIWAVPCEVLQALYLLLGSGYVTSLGLDGIALQILVKLPVKLVSIWGQLVVSILQHFSTVFLCHTNYCYMVLLYDWTMCSSVITYTDFSIQMDACTTLDKKPNLLTSITSSFCCITWKLVPIIHAFDSNKSKHMLEVIHATWNI